MNTDVLPWTSRNEWILVQENAYSGEYDKTMEAVRTLKSWKHFMKSSSRPGMDCTRELLEVALNDKEIFTHTKKYMGSSDLQLMYSAEIMRFLNLVCLPFIDGNKVSLYSSAKFLGIPDWVVNIRHQIAHQDSLPPIDILRMAVKFILSWLKENYWEVERNAMTEEKLEKPHQFAEENLNDYLAVYILLKEQLIQGLRAFKDIQDPDVRKLSLFIWRKIRCEPWNSTLHEKDSKELTQLEHLSVQKVVLSVVETIKLYIRNNDEYGVNTIQIIMENMIEDSVKHNGMRREVWKSLVNHMHSLQTFPAMISYLYLKSNRTSGEYSYQAGMWAVELCKALLKRYKVQTLNNFLIRGRNCSYDKNVNGRTLELKETKEFIKMLRKRKSNIHEKNHERRRNCIFPIIEERFPDLRDVLRLRDAVFPDHWEVLKLFNIMCPSPNDFIEECLINLQALLSCPLSTKDLKNLIAVTKIYRGEDNISKRKRFYRVEDLLNLSVE